MSVAFEFETILVIGSVGGEGHYAHGTKYYSVVLSFRVVNYIFFVDSEIKRVSCRDCRIFLKVAVSSMVVKEREHVKRRIVRSDHLYRVVVIVGLKDFFIFMFNIWGM